MKDILSDVSRRVELYLNDIENRRVFPTKANIGRLSQLDTSLPVDPTTPEEVIKQLDDIASPATVASTGGRYFGYVVGG